jgi:hypothetical protein
MSHITIYPWADIAVVNPNDGIEYAYIVRLRKAPNCNVSTAWTGCMFILANEFDPGGTLSSLNGQLQVGQFVGIYYPAQPTQCVEILKIIDEAEYNMGLGIMNCPSDFANSHGTFNNCPCNVIYGDMDRGNWAGAGTPSIFYDCNTCIVSGPGPGPGTGISGCMNPTATNYNPLATIDDGSCIGGLTPGCCDPTAINFDPLATCDDGSCLYTGGGGGSSNGL